MDLLQIFLLIDIFVLGVAATIAVQHGYTHFQHKRHPEKDHSSLKDSPLPAKLKEDLVKEAQESFRNALKNSADNMQHDLKDTSSRINLHLEKLGNDTIHTEVEKYRKQLEELYEKAEQDVGTAVADIGDYASERKDRLGELAEKADGTITEANQSIEDYKNQLKNKLDELYRQADSAVTEVNTDIEEHVKELKQQLSKDVAAEKEQLIDRFETKMADTVTSFLMEALKHEVDLGAQSKYLTSMLEEHKNDLLKELKNEVKTSK